LSGRELFLAAAVLKPAAGFLFDFPAVCLVAALNLGSSFLGPAVFLLGWSMFISTSYIRFEGHTRADCSVRRTKEKSIAYWLQRPAFGTYI